MKNSSIYFLALLSFLIVSCGGNDQAEEAETAPPAAEAPMPAPELKVWKLQSYGEPGNLTPVPSDMEVTLTMDLKENRISGKAACNNYTGSLDGTAVGTVVATKKACPGPAMEMETTFLKMLDMVTNSKVESGKMIMMLEDGHQLVFGV